MSMFVLAAAVVAIAITGLLTWLLYRMNAATLHEAGKSGDEDGPA